MKWAGSSSRDKHCNPGVVEDPYESDPSLRRGEDAPEKILCLRVVCVGEAEDHGPDERLGLILVAIRVERSATVELLEDNHSHAPDVNFLIVVDLGRRVRVDVAEHLWRVELQGANSTIGTCSVQLI